MTGVTCILNTTAGPGHGPSLGVRVRRLFARGGAAAHVVMVRDGAGLGAQAVQALDRGHHVVVGGGDGSVNAVASRLAGTGAVLGVLPLGTCNHFARDLGVPFDLDGAVRTILAGQVRAVDLGEVNGQVFLNNSSLGLYPRLVRGRVAEERRGHRKWVAAVLAVASCLRHPIPLLVHLRVDGTDAPARRTPVLFVGNNCYLVAGLAAGGRTRLDAGQLWVCVARDTGYPGLLALTVRALSRRLRPGDLEICPASELQVRTLRHRVEVAWDGEVTMMHAPLHYRIRPAALHVMVPR